MGDIQTYETRTEVDTTEEEKDENLQPIEENLNSETTTTTSTDTATIEPVISTKLENETEGKKIIEKEKEATILEQQLLDQQKLISEKRFESEQKHQELI